MVLNKEEYGISGIYCLLNKINNKCYIGKSVNIQHRYYAHVSSTNNINYPDSNFNIHCAMRKYGIDNFELIIIEECNTDDLYRKEQEYIKHFNSLTPAGYNMTEGGDCGPIKKGELNGRAKLTEEDVIFIRTKLLEGYNFRQIYPKYKNIISERGLKHVWWGTSWKHIMLEIYEDRDKLFANKNKGTNIGNRSLDNKDYKKIIENKKLGKNREVFWEENFKDKISLSAFNKYWYEYIRMEDEVFT